MTQLHISIILAIKITVKKLLTVIFSLSKNMCSRAQIREPRGSLRGSAAAAR